MRCSPTFSIFLASMQAPLRQISSGNFLPGKKTFVVGKGPEEDTPPIPVVIGGGPAMNQGTVILLTADSSGLRTKMFSATGHKVLHEDRYI